MKKTLVIGASTNPERYGYKATMMLKEYHHPVIPFGMKKGDIDGVTIKNELPKDGDFNTVTLYLNPKNQEQFYDYIIGLKPERVIFNPGTENPEFEHMLEQNGIKPVEACTLVMLRTGQF